MKLDKNWFTSIITDNEWDADGTKIVGIILIICSIVGFFCKIERFDLVMYAGCGLLGVGKFSKQG